MNESTRPVIPGYEDADPELVLLPEITVQLTGCDSSMGAILGTVRTAMRQADVEDCATVMRALTRQVFDAGSYAEALNIVMRYVNVT
jgi:hypothetical protein